jgi:methylmalonyl-CoA mutase
MPAKRLSTAFDSVTLYGNDPDRRPDIYGKVGNSGVSIATLDDMKVLYSGIRPLRSRDVGIDDDQRAGAHDPRDVRQHRDRSAARQVRKGTTGASRPTTRRTRSRAGRSRRCAAPVQADILKEDQGQNTCIFSTEFSLKVMGDIQEYFVRHGIRNFYSVSISGYHIAEAGANPISQLAFTLSNGFTFVEAYLARGMHVDDFAPNLSFFFSYGMDPEYSVIGRVARRIWAVAMKNRYGANERSQKLKFHSQTSGRSLHAQEIAFNDIRTTLQALISTYDNTKFASHQRLRRGDHHADRGERAPRDGDPAHHQPRVGARQEREPEPGSFIIDELTDLVEEAVLKEFEAISERGGVLGAMETGYQRGKIQEESMYYEHKKHDGSYPIVGVNTFRAPHADDGAEDDSAARSTSEEKESQLEAARRLSAATRGEADAALARLQDVVIQNGNIFEELVRAVRVCSLGQITRTLFEVGGQYRRSM